MATPTLATEPDHDGERLDGVERVILAPVTGRFSVNPEAAEPPAAGTIVLAGSALGDITTTGRAAPVTTPFTGVLAGLLAVDGERVRAGQPVAWLRASA